MFAFGETVIFESFILEGSEDAHGNPVDSFSPGVPIPGWGFDPGGSVESYAPGRDSVVTTPTLYRRESDFIPGRKDRCTVRGVAYQVEGNTAVWRSPLTGWAPGIVVKLEAVDG